MRTDDALMSLLYALWGALTTHVGMARENVLVGGVPSTQEPTALEMGTGYV